MKQRCQQICQKNSDTLLSTYRNDTYLGNEVVYAPLSSISDEYGNIGVFSPNFSFRKMIEGTISPTVDSDYYIPDYFSICWFLLRLIQF
ncbi:MAG: hypothetical protein L6U99_07340 [Clostridium sp.]|nr:MAG: hypothetical protein L6U99_07340 [Clostridium sp.]